MFEWFIYVLKGDEYKYWFEMFINNGLVFKVGEVWWLLDYVVMLFEIVEMNGEFFYRGDLVDKIVVFLKKYGGFLIKEDLVVFRVEWVKLILIFYWGYDVWEILLNG